MRNFRTYRVWQHGIDLVSKVYELTRQIPAHESYSLIKQMQRSAVSIPSNCAEGCSRESEKEFKHFVEISLGSAYELETQMIIADNLYNLKQFPLSKETYELLAKVQAELNALRTRLKED